MDIVGFNVRKKIKTELFKLGEVMVTIEIYNKRELEDNMASMDFKISLLLKNTFSKDIVVNTNVKSKVSLDKDSIARIFNMNKTGATNFSNDIYLEETKGKFKICNINPTNIFREDVVADTDDNMETRDSLALQFIVSYTNKSIKIAAYVDDKELANKTAILKDDKIMVVSKHGDIRYITLNDYVSSDTDMVLNTVQVIDEGEDL